MKSEKCTKFERVCLVDTTVGPLELVRGKLYITSMETDGIVAVYLDEPTEDNVVMVFTPGNQFAGEVEAGESWDDTYRTKYIARCAEHNVLKVKMRVVEIQVDKIRYAMHPIVEAGEVKILLNMFEEDSGNIKEMVDL